MFEGFIESLAVETWALAMCSYAVGAAASLWLGGHPRLARTASSATLVLLLIFGVRQ